MLPFPKLLKKNNIPTKQGWPVRGNPCAVKCFIALDGCTIKLELQTAIFFFIIIYLEMGCGSVFIRPPGLQWLKRNRRSRNMSSVRAKRIALEVARYDTPAFFGGSLHHRYCHQFVYAN